MASTYITRAERSGSIFFRVSGLIRSGQLAWSERPLWYDVYAAVPPLTQPVWNVKLDKHDEPVRKIFYEEDTLRAKFYKMYKQSGVINVSSGGDTMSQMFVKEFTITKTENPDLNEADLFAKTEERMVEAGIQLKK